MLFIVFAFALGVLVGQYPYHQEAVNDWVKTQYTRFRSLFSKKPTPPPAP